MAFLFRSQKLNGGVERFYYLARNSPEWATFSAISNSETFSFFAFRAPSENAARLPFFHYHRFVRSIVNKNYNIVFWTPTIRKQ